MTVDINDLEPWINRDPKNQSLEELQILISLLLEYLQALEDRVAALEP